jgi:hypothetical protein
MWGAAPCVSIGPRPDQVRAIAFKVAEILGYDPDAWNVRYHWKEPGWPLQG